MDILWENNIGFVGVCKCCGEVEFAIGNVISCMTREGFTALYKSLLRINSRIESRTDNLPNGRKVMLNTPVENFILAFSISEFKDIIKLFNHAIVKLRLLKSVEEINKVIESSEYYEKHVPTSSINVNKSNSN